MGIITLTTDLGIKDHYVAQLKGAIYSASPTATIVDVTHQVRPFDIAEAAFYVRNTYKSFPEGSVHIVGVKSEPHIDTSHSSSYLPSVMKYNNHYFVGTNNGIFGLITQGQAPQEFWEISDISTDPTLMNDPVRFMLAPAACKINNGMELQDFATPNKRIVNAVALRAIKNEFSILGHVIHVDSYGNLITNIEKEDFYSYGKDTPFILKLKVNGYHNAMEINAISQFYGEVKPGELVAFFNLNDLLEVAINQGTNGNGNGANKLLGINKGDDIFIDFSPRGSKEHLDLLF